MSEEAKSQTGNKAQSIALDFAQLSRLIINDLNNLSTTSDSIMRKYTKDDVIRFLDNPHKNEKQIRDLSSYLYNVSPNYKRLILYFSTLATFDHILEPYGLDVEKVNIDKFKKQYHKSISLLETMNLQHEFSKISKVIFREDVFYGYEHVTKDSYFIQKLNPDYCQISSVEDGVFNFSYDFTYFDKYKDKLKQYPKEFQTKYKIYLNDRKLKWQELSAENTICIKLNDDVSYVIPPFVSVFEAIFDIDEYKKLKRLKSKMDNYMILTQQIPISDKTDEPNQFLIDLETAVQFHNKATQSLPDEVGLVTSPMKIEAIKLEKKNTENDNVAQAERDYYNASGVSQFLFNNEKATSTGLSKSVVTDEQIIFSVLKQFERWVNRKFKYFNSTYKFKVKFLESTQFNKEALFERYLKAAERGIPSAKTMVAATLGISQSSMSNMAFLENQVLNYHENFIPLSSTHTQSGEIQQGKPKKSDDQISDSGDKTRQNDGNIRE